MHCQTNTDTAFYLNLQVVFCGQLCDYCVELCVCQALTDTSASPQCKWHEGIDCLFRGIDPPRTEAIDAFMPFALGRRTCIGQRLAYAELYTVVAKLAAEYNLEVEVEGSICVGLTMHQNGTRLIARKAKSQLD
mmetsp:Transcript_33479/g.50488  ORF Transcript_33479/g.50488 Transcript_33479/m.50488 type:complete len:134 (-) Transcript_33479:194-595(-)